MARSQVLRTGTSVHQLKYLVATRQLVPIRTGVYRVAGAPLTWEQHIVAAVLAGGDGAVASFRSAAWIWRLEGFEPPDALEITIRRRRRARLPGVIVHDSTVVGRRHHTVHTSIPVTTPARTLCDLTAVCGLGVVARALDDALRRRLTTLERTKRVFLDLANQGRRRSTFMRTLLEERLPGFEPGESEQEAKLLRWIVEAGLPRPTAQHRVRVNGRRYRLDLAYPKLKIGIEYDGWDAHRGRVAFDADPVRDNELREAGWWILHFTAASTRAYVVEKVENALRQRSR